MKMGILITDNSNHSINVYDLQNRLSNSKEGMEG